MQIKVQQTVAWSLGQALCLLLAMNFGVGVAGADELDAQLGKIIEELKTEAENLEKIHEKGNPPVWIRPHPAIKNIKPEDAARVLARVTGRFTGNDQRDAYIRWHLIYVVEKHLIEELETWVKTGEHEVSSELVRRMAQLPDTMPGQINLKRQPSTTYEPIEVWQEYRRNYASTKVIVGVPPFEKTYHGPASLPHVSGARKAEVERAIATMNKLKGKWKRVENKDARALNIRVDQVNRVIRDYRARVVYVMLQSGEERYLKDILQSTEKLVKAKDRAGFDLTYAMYHAAFDGYIALYDDTTVERFGRDLNRLAGATFGWERYEMREGVNPGDRRQLRNYGDYAFTLSQLMQERYKIDWLAHSAKASSIRTEVAKRPKSYAASAIASTDINAALERAMNSLENPPYKMGFFLLPPTEPEATGDKPGEVPRFMIDPSDLGVSSAAGIRYQTGYHALASWAQLACGQPYLRPILYRRIYFALTQDTRYTFDRSMRLQMLTMLPPTEFGDWARRDAEWMYSALSDKGNFSDQYLSGQSTDWGDHANGQYGVLGLLAADRAGFKLDRKAVERIDKHWRATQDKKSGGWSLQPLNVASKSNIADASEVSAQMTAGGVATLMITERILRGDKMASDADLGMSPELRRGIAWLDKNFALDPFAGLKEKQSPIDWFFYMWNIQRVSKITGIQRLNGIDLSREITTEILNRQLPSGLWMESGSLTDTNGNPSTEAKQTLISTSFAMLYLAEAVKEPIGIAKVIHGGNWANRPHDLWNFTDYARDAFESPMAWQSVSLQQPLRDLRQSPIVYISTDDQVYLKDVEIDKLRGYIQAGGLLLMNSDKRAGAASRNLADLAGKLFPQYEITDLPRDHAIYSVLHEVKMPAKQVTNGIRPLIIMPTADLGVALQKNDVDNESFKFLTNLYLYAVNRTTRRNRFDLSYVPQVQGATGLKTVQMARLDLGPLSVTEPAAMEQLSRFMAANHKIDLNVEPVTPEKISGSYKLAWLSAGPGVTMNDAQAKALKDWVDAGGTLVIDATGGSAEAQDAMSTALNQLTAGVSGHQLETFDPLINGQGLGSTAHDNSRIAFNRYTTLNLRVKSVPLLRAVDVGERPAILYSAEDLSAALAGVDLWGIPGYTPNAARQLAANLILAASK